MNIRIGAADYDVQYTDDAIILNGRECIAMVDFIRDNPEIVDKIKNGERLSI